MYRIGNKALKDGNRLYIGANQTILEFDSKGTCFPDRNTGSTYFQFNSLPGNKMYIDFDDGTGVHEYLPNTTSGTSFYYVGETIHFYQDLLDPSKIGTVDATYPQSRIVKVWFDYPQRITLALIQSFNMYGDFPKNIGNYSLDTMRFSGVAKLDSFPSKFRGGVFTSVFLSGVSTTRLTKFPNWIGNSKIINLTLQKGFDMSNGSVLSGIDGISNCAGLANLVLSDMRMLTNDDFPPNLKNLSTLRDLRIGANPYETFPTRISECSQLERLGLSHTDGFGYNTTMSSWGTLGLGLMVNLVDFTASGLIGLVSTDLPLGIENCVKLKKVRTSTTYRTQARIDEHVNKWYIFITSNASTTEGNTKFRDMEIDIGSRIGTNNGIRPSGAMPTAVVEPPTTPMQKIYNMCKLYGHTWIVQNLADTGTETITPTS